MQSDFRSRVARAGFRASPTTRDLCRKVQTIFGFRYYYEPLRMFMARSLVEPTPPPAADLSGKNDLSLRGEQLFGANDLDAWVSVLLESIQAGREPRLHDLRVAAEAHIDRGAGLFELEAAAKDWHAAGIVRSLAEHLPRSMDENVSEADTIVDPIQVEPGDVSEDMSTKEPVRWVLNRAARLPHLLVLGRDDRARAGTALFVAEQANAQQQVPVLVIDTEGHCRELLRSGFAWVDGSSALEVVDVGKRPVPLNLFESSRHGTLFFAHQGDRAIECLQRALPELRGKKHASGLRRVMDDMTEAGELLQLSRIAEAYGKVVEASGSGESALAQLRTLAASPLFEARFTPSEFFRTPRLIDLSGIADDNLRHLVTLLLIETLTAWLEGSSPAAEVAGHRKVRHMVVLDRATRLFAEPNHRALDELLGIGWSRGEAVVLTTPDPDDLQRQPRSRASQFGGAIAFACHARRGMRLLGDIYGRKLLQDEFRGGELPAGLAFCRLPGQDARKIQCWTVEAP